MLRYLLPFVVLASAVAAADPAPSRPELKLLDAGKGPKHKLRMHPAVGVKHTFVMTMNMEMAMDAGAALHVPRTKLPAVKMYADMTTLDVNKAGDSRYEFVIQKYEVVPGTSPPVMVDAMKKGLDKLAGLKGTASVDARNFSIGGAFDIPANADDMTRQVLSTLQQSISQMSCPFPEPAIGVGARWREYTSTPINGILLHQTLDYEVTAIDGDRVTVAVKIAQKPDPKPVPAPNAPPGTTMSVVHWKGGGSGTMTLDTSKWQMPEHATLALSTDGELDIANAGTHQDLKMFVGVDITIE